jgi:predicted dehydrogenase
MGTEMLASAAAHPDFAVVCAYDVSPAATDRARTRHPDVSFVADAREVVESPDVDAVYIATPPMFHAEPAIAAMRAGNAVFCEKPLAISLTDGRGMVAAAAESGVAAAVNFALSDRNAVLELERSLAADDVGQVSGIEVRLSFPQWPRDFQANAAWLAGRDQGGLVREVLSHFVYLTDRLLGPIDPVEVGVDFPLSDPHACEVAAHGFLRAGGVPVHVSAFCGIAAPELYEWILWGTRRSYLLRNWGELLVSDGAEWQPVPLTQPRGSEATRLALFAGAVRGANPRYLADFATALRVQEIVEAFHHTNVVGQRREPSR